MELTDSFVWKTAIFLEWINRLTNLNPQMRSTILYLSVFFDSFQVVMVAAVNMKLIRRVRLPTIAIIFLAIVVKGG